MIYSGTYIGITTALFIAYLFVRTVRWQVRYGGFWLYSVLLAFFFMPVVFGTFMYTITLSDSLLTRSLPYYPEAKTIEDLRLLMIGRNNSNLLPTCAIFAILSGLVGLLTSSKARRRAEHVDRGRPHERL